MRQRMDDLTLLRKTTTINAWREAVTEWTESGTIKAALSEGGGRVETINELQRIDATHTAVTAAAVRTGERLRAADGREYDVRYVVPADGRRYAQLYLRTVEAVSADAD